MAYKAYTSVSILFFINLINYMDRFTIPPVLKNVEHVYKLSTSEDGLLQTAFIFSYLIMSPVFGYLGDRYSRKYLMAFGVFFWSTTTFLGSLIPASFPLGFFLMRALVGTGEASYSTLAPTIIADLFPKEMRTRMLALFYFAIPVGSGLGYIVGGEMATLMHDWRWALRITPVLGIISVICLLLFLDEPPRGFSDGAVQQIDQQSNLKDDIKYLLSVRSYLWSTGAFTCVCFAIGAMSWFAPEYMQDATKVSGNQQTANQISFSFGIITCIAGIIGVVAGSGGAQIYRKYNQRADPLVCGFAVLLAVPFMYIGLVIPHISLSASWVLIFLGITCLCMNWALVADMLLYIIVPNKRGIAQAIQITISHLLGDATSPTIIGIIRDSFKNQANDDWNDYTSLQYSLYIPTFILIFGSAAFLYTATFIVGDRDLCKAQIQGIRNSPSETSIHTLPPNATPTTDSNTNTRYRDTYVQSMSPSDTLSDYDRRNLIETL